MKRFLTLFVSAYAVALIGVPVAMMFDHLGRGATPIRALGVIPLWVFYTAAFALPFVLVASVLAVVLLGLDGDWWQNRWGRILFPLICAGMGAALVALLAPSLAPVAAASGGVAGWLSLTPQWPTAWRSALVAVAGLVTGGIVGIQYY